MGKSIKEQINDTLLSKLAKNSLYITIRLLTSVGKPLYFMFTYIFLAIVFTLGITKTIVFWLSKLVYLLSITLFKLLLFSVRHIILLRTRIKIILRKRKGIIFSVKEKKLAYPGKMQSLLSHLEKVYLNHFSPLFATLRKASFFLATITTKSILSALSLVTTSISLLKASVRLFSMTSSPAERGYPSKEDDISGSIHPQPDGRGFLESVIKINTRISSFPSTDIKKKTKKPARLKYATLLLLFFITIIAGSIFSFWLIILKDLPAPVQLTKRNIEASTKIYDRNGILLYKIYKDKNRTPISLDKIPKHVILATLAIEDEEFYSHPGFSIKGIARAAFKIIQEGNITGGSTITQQLVKNTLLSPEKTIIRKLKEITLAVLVELTYEKDQIFEMYLNEVGYGGTAYGIQEAAKTYFGKNVQDLNLPEAALLAGLIKSPTKYSPFVNNPDAANERKNEVLKQMQVNGFITEEQKNIAESEVLKFAENKTGIIAPHFVMYARQYLEDLYGKNYLENSGLEVTTTLDLNIQLLAEKVVSQEVEKLKKLNVGNGSALVINPKTGEILAMVGSTDYFNTEKEGNVNVTTQPRQPGSSIKIVNYAYALSDSYTAATIVKDTPVTFLVDGQPPYTPRNYEGGFRGNLTLRSAFAESRNIPAVKVLESYGVKNMISMGQKMGIASWTDPKNYGLSLTLGGGEVTLLELATAYSTVANYGKKPTINPILIIKDYKGKLIAENDCLKDKNKSLVAIASASDSAKTVKKQKDLSCEGKQVVDPRVAFILTDILKDNSARTPAFGSNSLLNIPSHKEVAVKTGTSNNLRDNLAIGYNQDYLVAAWVGNNDNSEMSRIASGVTGATPIFNKIMSALLQESSNHDWGVPNGLIQIPICAYTGTLACDGCPTKLEWFLEENKPDKACSSEWFKKEEEGKVEQVDQVNQEVQGNPEFSQTRPDNIEVIDKRKTKKRVFSR